MSKLSQFYDLVRNLNEAFGFRPLLYGSLGLEQRLGRELGADDIDVLIPAIWLTERWEELCGFLEKQGYCLYDPHEHAFLIENVSIAFASVESLEEFAGIDIAKIPEIRYNNICYLLLDLEDYKKVYTASSRDGYRKDKKHKNDAEKIALIDEAISRS